uniref:OTU domain-containing protein n=1 Tax=Rhabditophanes sp. KR3021 TaxID=114890 RepID=A0AC35U2G5_9BILA
MYKIPYEDNTVVDNQHPGVIEKVNWVGEMDGSGDATYTSHETIQDGRPVLDGNVKGNVRVVNGRDLLQDQELSEGNSEKYSKRIQSHHILNKVRKIAEAEKNQMFVGKISSVEHPESLNTGCNEYWAINNCQDGSNAKGNEVVALIDNSNTETVAINEIGGIQEVASVDSSMQTALPIEDSPKSSHSSSLYSLLLSTNAYDRTNFVNEILNYIPTRQFISRGSQTDLHFDGCIHDELKMELQREGLWKLVNYFGDRVCSSQENFMGVTDCGGYSEYSDSLDGKTMNSLIIGFH